MSADLHEATSTVARAAVKVALRAGVHAAMAGQDLVLLDVGSDSYVCIRGDEDHALAVEADGRTLRLSSDTLARELADAGLLAANVPPGARPDTVPRPEGTALRDHYGMPVWRDLPEALATLAAVLRDYRGRAFSDVIAPPKHSPPAAASVSVQEVCDRFHRWVPFAPVSGKCLLRAFMLRRLLHRAGHTPLWVFGVQTWPFSAHCWLQIGNLVLDDHPDRVAPYAPIMVVV